MSTPDRASFTPGAEAMAEWLGTFHRHEPPVFWPTGPGFEQIEIGPERVIVVGGPPGIGKTALVSQWLFDALYLAPEMRVLFCNAEMSPASLLSRELARQSGVPLGTVRRQTFSADERAAVERAWAAMENAVGRVAFMRPPFHVGNVQASRVGWRTDVVVIDYCQRFRGINKQGDERAVVGDIMATARELADMNVGVVVLSALARSKDLKGRSSYDAPDVGLGSFRESSELEFGADDAFVLCKEKGSPPSSRLLKHVKSRNGEQRDLSLHFDGARQRFTVADDAGRTEGAVETDLMGQVETLWDSTPGGSD